MNLMFLDFFYSRFLFNKFMLQNTIADGLAVVAWNNDGSSKPLFRAAERKRSGSGGGLFRQNFIKI